MGDDRHPAGREHAPGGRGDHLRSRRRAVHLGPVLPRAGAGRRGGRRPGPPPAHRGRRRAGARRPRVIAVAGGTGTLGTRLVPCLAGQGHAVRVLTRDPARAAHLAGPGVEVARADLRDTRDVAKALDGAGTVISAVHGFAGPGGVSPASVDRAGNANLIGAAARAGASFVLVSVVGAAPAHPIELFRAKHAAEETLRASGIPWTIVRATAFMETWATIMSRPLQASGKILVFGRGDNPVNFVSAADVAALVARAVTDPGLRGQALELGGPDNLTFNQVAAILQESTE